MVGGHPIGPAPLGNRAPAAAHRDSLCAGGRRGSRWKVDKPSTRLLRRPTGTSLIGFRGVGPLGDRLPAENLRLGAAPAEAERSGRRHSGRRYSASSAITGLVQEGNVRCSALAAVAAALLTLPACRRLDRQDRLTIWRCLGGSNITWGSSHEKPPYALRRFAPSRFPKMRLDVYARSYSAGRHCP